MAKMKTTTTTPAAARKADPKVTPAPEEELGMPSAAGPAGAAAYMKAALRAVAPEFAATLLLGLCRSDEGFNVRFATAHQLEGDEAEKFRTLVRAIVAATTEHAIASPPAGPKATPKARKRKGA